MGTEDHDAAISESLNMLAADIEAGQNIGLLPDDLVQALQKYARYTAVQLEEEIEGDVAL